MNVPFLQNATFTGLISTKDYGTSESWYNANSFIQSASSNWENTSTTVQSNSSNWNNAYTTTTVYQTNSAAFAPSPNDYSVDTDLDSFEKTLVLVNVGAVKKIPAITLAYQKIDGTVVQLSGTGNGYGGNFNFTNISPVYNNKYITFNNLNHIDGSLILGSSVLGLTAINFPGLQSVMGGMQIQGSPNMIIKECVLPELLYIGGYFSFGTTGNTNTGYIQTLETINCPKLIAINNSLTIGGYGYTQAPRLSSVLFPKLESVNGSITIGGSLAQETVANRPLTELRTLDFSNLKNCTGVLTLQNIPNLTSFTLSSLEVLGGSPSFPSCSALTDVNFPNLQLIGGYSSLFSNSNTNSLTSMSMPNIIAITAGSSFVQFATVASLRNLEFGTDTLKLVSTPGTFNVAQTLTQQSVDNLLKAFARLDGTNGTTLFTGALDLGGSNSAPSYTGGVTTTSDGTNFVRTGTTVIASVVSHGHTNGDIVTFTGNSQSTLNGTYIITVNSLDEFQYTTPTSSNITGGGTVTMRRTTVSTDGFRYFQTIALRGTTVTMNFPA